MIKGILFDFDYTLGDSTMGIVQSANYALEQLGHTGKSEDAIKRTIGLSLTDTFLALEPDAPKEEAAQNAQVLFAAVLTGTTGKEEFDSYPHGMIGNHIQDVYQYVKSYKF